LIGLCDSENQVC